MGSSVSRKLKENECIQSTEASQSTFGMLYFGTAKTLYALEFPPEITRAITVILKRQWKDGIIEYLDGGRLGYWKLEKYPWIGTGKRGIVARRIVRDILAMLFSHGYVLEANMRLCRRSDSDCFCFRGPRAPGTVGSKSEEAARALIQRGTLGTVRPGNPPSIGLLCLQGTDRLRVADVDSATIDLVRSCVASAWSKGIQCQRNYLPGCVEFKLNGNPWVAVGAESATTRSVLGAVFHALRGHGWKPISSITLSIFNDHASTFYLLRDFDKCGLTPPGETREYAEQPSPSPLQSTAKVPSTAPAAALPCLSLNNTNKVRLGSFPPQLRESIGALIHRTWGPGVGKEGRVGSMYEWELKGSPWYPGPHDVEGVALLCDLLRHLRLAGLQLLATADMSQRIGGLDTLYFQDEDKGAAERGLATAAIFPHGKNKITVIGGDDDVAAAVDAAVRAHWREGMKARRPASSPRMGRVEAFKLKGKPWVAGSGSSSGVQVRRMVLAVIEAMEAAGWRVLACVDVSRSADKYGMLDVDCMIFEKSEAQGGREEEAQSHAAGAGQVPPTHAKQAAVAAATSPSEQWRSSSAFKPPPIALPPPKRSIALYNQRYALRQPEYIRSPTHRK